MSNARVDIDFGSIGLIILFIMCYGDPDIIDGIVYHLTEVKVWIDEAQPKDLM